MSPDCPPGHAGARQRVHLLVLGLACALASLVAIKWFDLATVRALAAEHWWRTPMNDVQRVIDWALLKPISALVGPVVVLAGWYGWRKGRLSDRFVMGWGALITAGEYTVDALKQVMGRERPHEWLGLNEPAGRWFEAAHVSFPSGHTAYYWALALPLLLRFPRLGWAALVLAIYVSAERILVLAHHPGDVLAAMAIVFLWAAALHPWLVRRAAGQGGSA